MKNNLTKEQETSALECILGQKTVGFYPVIAKALGSPNPYSSGIMAVGFLVVVAFAYLIFNKVKNKKHGK